MSVAAFSLSYHQIIKAFEQSPRDFANVDAHIESLESRVHVFGSVSCMKRLIVSAINSTRPPYQGYDYSKIAETVFKYLSLLTRADLEVMKYIRQVSATRAIAAGGTAKSKSKSPATSPCGASTEVTLEQLEFLRSISEKKDADGKVIGNKDLWSERSAHTYSVGEQHGVIIVFPSGYLYSILAPPEVTPQKLMEGRTEFCRMESLIPYIPYELSGNKENIANFAAHEMEFRKKKTIAKMDIDSARSAIVRYMKRLATSMITDPMFYDLMKKRPVARQSPVAAPSPIPKKTRARAAPPPPPITAPSDSDADTDIMPEPDAEDS
jgi:hypothetical protein